MVFSVTIAVPGLLFFSLSSAAAAEITAAAAVVTTTAAAAAAESSKKLSQYDKNGLLHCSCAAARFLLQKAHAIGFPFSISVKRSTLR